MRRVVSRFLLMRPRCVPVGVVLALVTAGPAPGQAAPGVAQRAEMDVCLGFSFGPWTPALDWQLAGHGAAVDSALVPRAPGGRGWAASNLQSPADTALMLFPTWWPVGVVVELSTRAWAAGDTVAGRATALIADGRQQAPTSRVKAWPVPCGR